MRKFATRLLKASAKDFIVVIISVSSLMVIPFLVLIPWLPPPNSTAVTLVQAILAALTTFAQSMAVVAAIYGAVVIYHQTTMIEKHRLRDGCPRLELHISSPKSDLYARDSLKVLVELEIRNSGGYAANTRLVASFSNNKTKVESEPICYGTLSTLPRKCEIFTFSDDAMKTWPELANLRKHVANESKETEENPSLEMLANIFKKALRLREVPLFTITCTYEHPELGQNGTRYTGSSSIEYDVMGWSKPKIDLPSLGDES